MISRQFYRAMYQLGELQRLRRSGQIPPAVDAHISTRIATASVERSQAINHNYQTNPRSALVSISVCKQVQPQAKIHRSRETWQLLNRKLPNKPKKCSIFNTG